MRKWLNSILVTWLIRERPRISLLKYPPPRVPYTGLPHYLRWCVLSTPEIQKCGDMAVAFSRQRLKPEIQCVSAESPEHCMEQIQVEWAREEAAPARSRVLTSHPSAQRPKGGEGAGHRQRSSDKLTGEGRGKEHSWLGTDLGSKKVSPF